MLHVVTPGGTYDPETIAVMSAAFDKACHSLSKRFNANDDCAGHWRWQSFETSIGESATRQISELASSEMLGRTAD